jgi:hypothetical protein
MRAAIRLAACCGVFLSIAAPARAEPLHITSGALAWSLAQGGPPRITLTGTGFTFDGRGGTGVFMARDQCLVPECVPGTAVDLHATWSGSDLPGTATLGGRTFTPVGSLASDASLLASWSGELLLPADFSGGAVSAPFWFSGLFFYSSEPTAMTGPLDLFGQGRATLTFAPSSVAPGTFALSAARYEFGGSPVPEPASMVLIGTGLAGLAALRRRAHRNRRQQSRQR